MRSRLANSDESFCSSVSWRQSQSPISSGYAMGFPARTSGKRPSTAPRMLHVVPNPDTGSAARGKIGSRPRPLMILRAERFYQIRIRNPMSKPDRKLPPSCARLQIPASNFQASSGYRRLYSFGHRVAGLSLLRSSAGRGGWHRTGFVTACNSEPTPKH